jgi:hypothetical protein
MEQAQRRLEKGDLILSKKDAGGLYKDEIYTVASLNYRYGYVWLEEIAFHYRFIKDFELYEIPKDLKVEWFNERTPCLGVKT